MTHMRFDAPYAYLHSPFGHTRRSCFYAGMSLMLLPRGDFSTSRRGN